MISGEKLNETEHNILYMHIQLHFDIKEIAVQLALTIEEVKKIIFKYAN